MDRQIDRLTDTALESPETNSHSTQKRTRLTETRTETLAEVPRHVGPHPHLDSETHARKTLQRARLSYSIYILYEATPELRTLFFFSPQERRKVAVFALNTAPHINA